MIRLLPRTFIDLRQQLWPQFTSSLSRHIKHLYSINWPCRWPNEAVRSCKFPHDCEHQQRLVIIEGFSLTQGGSGSGASHPGQVTSPSQEEGKEKRAVLPQHSHTCTDDALYNILPKKYPNVLIHK